MNFEKYSILSTAVTETDTTAVTTITVSNSENFSVGGVIIIDPVFYSEHSENTPNH